MNDDVVDEEAASGKGWMDGWMDVMCNVVTLLLPSAHLRLQP
jgi:hypothetical protein